jgi:FkbM family methyltransferase
MIYEANGCKFYAEKDMIVMWERRENKKFEPETTEWMLDKMTPEGAFIDVGASTGWFTVLMAKRGYEVHAFEPNVRVLPRLRANLELNEVKAEVYEAAVSDKTGTATFIYNPNVPLTSGGSLTKILPPTKATETVPTLRLDDLELPKPAVVKIDVERHEMAVLRGAERYIMEHRPPMVLEANEKEYELELAEWLGERGYSYRIADERNLLCEC